MKTLEDLKTEFEQGLVAVFRCLMGEYDDFSKSDFAKFSKAEISTMGNIKNPENGKVYGFKLSIGSEGAFESDSDEDDSDE